MKKGKGILKLEKHPWYKVYQAKSIEKNKRESYTIKALELEVSNRIYENETDLASTSQLELIFMPFFQNGTFFVGERSKSPEFIREHDHSNLDAWLKDVVKNDLSILQHEEQLPKNFDKDDFDRTASAVSNAFLYNLDESAKLCDLIPYQNYIDYIRRGIGLFVFGDENKEFYTETEYTQLGVSAALKILSNKLENESLRTLMLYALLAGVLGLDLKCCHCAASSFGRESAIFLEQESIHEIYSSFQKKVDRSINLAEIPFAWKEFEARIIKPPCRLLFFPDDVPETVFDLFLLQKCMEYNTGLSVDVLPRAKKYHNDASFNDVSDLVSKSIFSNLRRFQDEGRFRVFNFGPKNGSVEGPKLSRQAADLIISSEVLYVKGSRSYELLASGIRIPTFFGQTISREFSESISGIDATSGIPTLFFVHAFPSFWGFKERHKRIESLWPTGRRDWMLPMTAIESARFTNSTNFLSAISESNREELSIRIINSALTRRVSPHRLLHEL